MASLHDAQVNLTTCSICFETFKKPKHLPCLHTFCEECISNYISSVFIKEGKNSFTEISCPLCRLKVVKPEHINAEDWGKNLPSNHLIINVMDCERLNKEKLCNPCERENESESATRWCVECRDMLCEKCAKTHAKLRVTMSHKVVSLSELSENSPITNSSCVASYCEKHQQKILEAYCSDHGVACCISCVTIEHRKCDNVGTIESVAKEVRESKKLVDLEKFFLKSNEKMEKMIDATKQNLEEVSLQYEDHEQEIEKTYIRLQKLLENGKEKSLKELTAVRKEVEPKIESTRDEYICQKSVINNCLNVVQHGLQFASDAQLLIEVQKLFEQKSNLKDYINNATSHHSSYKIEFQESFEASNVESKLQCLGSTSCLQTHMFFPDVDMLKGTPKLIRSFEVNKTYFFGGIVLEDDTLLISTYTDKKLELFSADGKSLSHLEFDERPFDVAMHENCRNGVVSSWEGRCITLFEMADEKLLKKNAKQFNSCCGSVRYKNDQVFVACQSVIMIVNGYTGDSVRTLSLVFGSAQFLELDLINSLVYYSSYGKVNYASFDGSKKGILFNNGLDVSQAASIVLDFEQNIYIMDFGTKKL
ncbi:hypothetical protein FSP39_023405 [Pinctada imbricata]|uniref:Uncharacterized protein n=1 Tax=Pinctada imbricata TaxID=66713 RepID=A0AA89C321_PINIB|nr:hypothetical protein FSP39_023405 [Pinctada imbricata]